MDFDLEFWNLLSRVKLKVKLRAETRRLLKIYCEFYAVPPDQVTDTALNQLMVSDPTFVDLIRNEGKQAYRLR